MKHAEILNVNGLCSYGVNCWILTTLFVFLALILISLTY